MTAIPWPRSIALSSSVSTGSTRPRFMAWDTRRGRGQGFGGVVRAEALCFHQVRYDLEREARGRLFPQGEFHSPRMREQPSTAGHEVIDLYQIHWPADDLSETQEGWTALAALQKEGKVRWIGASNFSREELQAAQLIAPITSLQPPYSLIRREIENGVLPYCKEQGIGVIAYSPMGSGLLTGTMTRERVATLAADDWRSKSSEFQEPKLSAESSIAQRVKVVADRRGVSPGAVAAAWTLQNPAVTGAIIGARNARQVEEIFPHADVTLAPEEVAEIQG